MKDFKKDLLKTFKKDQTYQDAVEFESWLFELCYTIAIKRREKGLSQKEFANKLRVSQSTIGRIESGQNMTCNTLWKISNALEEDLIIFEVSKQKESHSLSNFLHNKIAPQIDATPQNNYNIFLTAITPNNKVISTLSTS